MGKKAGWMKKALVYPQNEAQGDKWMEETAKMYQAYKMEKLNKGETHDIMSLHEFRKDIWEGQEEELEQRPYYGKRQ